MAGLKVFRKLQFAPEVTPGTAVATTQIWRGVGTYEDQRKQPYVEEEVGIVGGGGRRYLSNLLAQVTMGETPVTYQHLPYILSAGIKTVAAAADGVGTDFIYAYTFPTTSANTIKTYTLEVGDNQQAEKMEYGFVTDFNLKGAGGSDTDACMMDATWAGRQLATTTYTGSLSLATLNEAIFPL